MPSCTSCTACARPPHGAWRADAAFALESELGRLRGRIVGQGPGHVARILALEAEAHGFLAQGDAEAGEYPVLARQIRTSGEAPGDRARQAILEAQLWRARVVALEQAGERARRAVQQASKACEAARAIKALRTACGD